MFCNCWTEVNAKLKEHNLRLNCASIRMPSFTLVPTLSTEWIDPSKAPKGKKRYPTQLMASHCPLCGTEIPEEKKGGTQS